MKLSPSSTCWLAALTLSCSETAAPFAYDVPEDSLRRIQWTDHRSRWGDLELLRFKPIREQNEEFRCWVAGGLQPVFGFIVRREGSTFSGYYIHPISADYIAAVEDGLIEEPIFQTPLTPKDGWEEFWRSTESNVVLNTKAKSPVPLEDQLVFDGNSVIFEYRSSNQYFVRHKPQDREKQPSEFASWIDYASDQLGLPQAHKEAVAGQQGAISN